MNVKAPDRAVVAALQQGLPLQPRPFAALARCAGLDECYEPALVDATRKLVDSGIVARFGIVVRHRTLGYVHNAMVVWDVANDAVDRVGEEMARFEFVTLCYRRPRRPPQWPYNLFCMIHGRERATVERQVRQLARLEGLQQASHELLFSRRCFKQRGARYVAGAPLRAGKPAQRESAGSGAP